MELNVSPAITSLNCRVCGAGVAEARQHQVREMFFGTREWFSYLECPACGSLQIEQIPSDLARFYPSNYYAQTAPVNYTETLPQRARYFFRGQLTLKQLGRPSLAGRLIGSFYSAKNALPKWLDSRHVDVTLDSRILDVGCGNGVMLSSLRRFGFRRLEGIEPFIKAAIDCGAFKIHRTSLAEFKGGGYDFIMLHHVLEHLPDPAASLAQLARMLAPDGRLMVRIPVAGCAAWRQYGTDWVQLDAPRHLVLFTPKALEQLARRCGLELCGTYYDSSAFQFWASEQYRRDIPLEDPRSVGHDRPLGSFTRQEMDEFIRKSEAANQNQTGDQAVFYFRKTGSVSSPAHV
jgi:2-polyprenyl-3-methyl-5-hydroxy-6-metoxy-1,4-benzoquinol methylase